MHRGNIDYSRPDYPPFDDTTPLYRFTAYTYRKNGAMLPEWPAAS
jgi:hypothetical protein